MANEDTFEIICPKCGGQSDIADAIYWESQKIVCPRCGFQD